MAREIETPAASGADETAHQVKDFGRALFHATVENTYNSVAQLAKHGLSVDLPELHLVDGDAAGRSAGGFIGNIAGTALNFYALNKVTGSLLGGLGGSGIAGSALRMGINGAIYEGILTPSDSSSQNFLSDRVTSGLVGATTFAAMGAAGHALQQSGLFKVPELRSLTQSMLFGGLSAAPAGIAHAEANALFKQGQLFPDARDLAKDVGTMAAFGAAYGAVGYGYHRLTDPKPFTITSGDAKITVQTDKSGRAVAFESETNAAGRWATKGERVFWKGELKTDGTWSESSHNQYGGEAGAPGIRSISVDKGIVKIIDESGADRTWTQGKQYESQYTREAKRLEDLRWPQGSEGDKTSWRRFDQNGRLTKLAENDPHDHFIDEKGVVNGRTRMATIEYGDGGQIKKVYLEAHMSDRIHVEQNPNGSYRISTHDFEYDWNGRINVNAKPGQTQQATIDFVAANGQKATFDARSGKESLRSMEQLFDATAIQKPGGAHGRPYVQANADGTYTINGGSSGYVQVSVKGEPLATGAVATIQPGTPISIKADVGDRYPIWETKEFKWKNAGKDWHLDGRSLAPNRVVDLFIPY